MPLLSSLASAASYLGIQLPWMLATISGTSTSSSIGNFRTVTFRGNGSFTLQGLSSISSRNRARVIIAAGGGGGSNGGGGGGGGGVLRNESYSFTSPATFTVTVGGAAGGNTSGSNTSFGSITAYGGGTGGSTGGSGGGYNGSGSCPPHGGGCGEGDGYPGQNHGGPDINVIVSSPFIGSGIGSQYGMTGGGQRSFGQNWGASFSKGSGGGGALGITTSRKTPSNPTGNHNGHGGAIYWHSHDDNTQAHGGHGGGGHRYIDSTFGIDWRMGHGGGGSGGANNPPGHHIGHETSGGSGFGFGGNGSSSGAHGCPYAPCNPNPFAAGCFAAAGPGVPGNPNPNAFGNGGGGVGAYAGGLCSGDECHPCGGAVQATTGGGGSGGVVILKYQFQGN